jgi:hypothetical protein
MNNRWFRNRVGEQRGAVLVLTAVAMVAMIGATALAVDVGQVANNNRSLQRRHGRLRVGRRRDRRPGQRHPQ